MPSVAVLQHGPTVPLGRLRPALSRRGLDHRLFRVWREPLPVLDDHDALVVLGGIMGAYDVDQYPWLAPEKDLLRRAVEAGIPVLGICLGCQLLADALGGSAYLGPSPEARFEPIRLTAAGVADPVTAALTTPVVVMHQDTWDLPPGAELLADTDRYPQAFRLGSAVGLQPHPEADGEILAGWLDDPHGRRLAERGGADPDLFLAAARAGDPATAAAAAAVFDGFLRSIDEGV